MYKNTIDIELERQRYKILNIIDNLADEAEATAKVTNGIWDYGYWRGIQRTKQLIDEVI